MLLIEHLKRKGFYYKTLSQFENFGGAIARLILNRDVLGLLDRAIQKAARLNQLHIDHILDLSKGRLNKVKFANLKLETVKTLIRHYSALNRMRDKCLPVTKRLVNLMKNEIFSMNSQNLSNFFYRVFSSQVKIFQKNNFFR